MQTTNTHRAASWGHWGITFFMAEDKPAIYFDGIIDGDAVSFIGQVDFRVVNGQGPIDGHLGSPLRLRYQQMCKDWRESGKTPEGLYCPLQMKWLYSA